MLKFNVKKWHGAAAAKSGQDREGQARGSEVKLGEDKCRDRNHPEHRDRAGGTFLSLRLHPRAGTWQTTLVSLSCRRALAHFAPSQPIPSGGSSEDVLRGSALV